MRVGKILVVRPYDTIYIYSDEHTSAHEEIKISQPNLSEGGSLRSPIILIMSKSLMFNINTIWQEGCSSHHTYKN